MSLAARKYVFEVVEKIGLNPDCEVINTYWYVYLHETLLDVTVIINTLNYSPNSTLDGSKVTQVHDVARER